MTDINIGRSTDEFVIWLRNITGGEVSYSNIFDEADSWMHITAEQMRAIFEWELRNAHFN